MATIYSPPTQIKVPNLAHHLGDRYDLNGYRAAVAEYEAEVVEFARRQGSGDLAGEIVRFSVADGYASYVVFKQRPLTLLHLETGDAYRLPEFAERGLAIADIRQRVAFSRKWDALAQRNA